MKMRSPLAFATSFRSPPVRGNEDELFVASTLETAERASAAGLDVEAVKVPGDH